MLSWDRGKPVYNPMDQRFIWAKKERITLQPGLPLLEDQTPAGFFDEYRNMGTRVPRDAYNQIYPLTLIGFNVWAGCAHNGAFKDKKLLDNGIRSTICAAPDSLTARGKRGITHLKGILVNDVIQGTIDKQEFYDAIVCMHKACTREGLVLYCRNGANRTATVACGYLMARCRCEPAEAESFLRRLRVIISLDKMDDHITHPRTWLEDHKEELWDVIRKACLGFQHSSLPDVTDAANMARICGGRSVEDIELEVNRPLLVWRPRRPRASGDAPSAPSRASQASDLPASQPPGSPPGLSASAVPYQPTLDELKNLMDNLRAELLSQEKAKWECQQNVDRMFRLIYMNAEHTKLMDFWNSQTGGKQPHFDMTAADACGMTFLHHAAREGHEKILDDILQSCPWLANENTYPCRKPGNWTPLQCMADIGRPADASLVEKHGRMALQLLNCMTQEAVFNRTTNGTMVFHQMVSHGHYETLELLLRDASHRS